VAAHVLNLRWSRSDQTAPSRAAGEPGPGPGLEREAA
jgi:hypothetical protein